MQWIVLTNGDEYRIYNTHAPVVVEEKLFRTVKVTSDDPTGMQTLELLAKNRLEENRIEVLWRAHFVDRQVKAAIESLFSVDKNDMLLVNYVASATKKLTAEEIRGSIARCHLSLDFPVDITSLMASGKKARKQAVQPTAAGTTTSPGGATLHDLIASGALRPPIELVKTYKGMELNATILANGQVRVGKVDCDSPSTAAVVAMKDATGIDRTANGWDFWQVETESGERVPLATFRDERRKGGRATG